MNQLIIGGIDPITKEKQEDVSLEDVLVGSKIRLKGHLKEEGFSGNEYKRLRQQGAIEVNGVNLKDNLDKDVLLFPEKIYQIQVGKTHFEKVIYKEKK